MWSLFNLASQNVCFFMELNDHNKIVRIKSHYYVCFDSELSYGTIIYGTLFVHNYTTYFSTQDVLYYKGTDLRRNNVSMVERYSILENMFHYHIKQVSYFKNNVVVGMSIIHTDFQTLIQSVKTIPYPVEYIQFRYTTRRPDNNIVNMKYNGSIQHYQNDSHNNNNQHSTTMNEQLKKEMVFRITPDIQNDIYHLHYYDPTSTNKDNFYAVACIPDYKTSVLMNRLFRNIKENQCLDALEESDDEEEFEDDRQDKFVFLEKSYKMSCVYHFKHKKWTPTKVAPRDAYIVTKKELPVLPSSL